MMEVISFTKYEENPENKEIFTYGFKHIKTDKVDNYILIGCESDELYENDKLFNFWSYMNKEIEMRHFEITGWSSLTVVKRNNFLIIQGVCYKMM